MLGFLIVLLLVGLLVGFLARLLVPGPNQMSVGMTALIGAVGTIVSGLIGRALFGATGQFGSLVFAVVITMGLIVLTGRSRTRHSI